MAGQAGARLETALQTLHEGLSRQGTTRRVEKVWQRIGRLQPRHPSAVPHTARSTCGRTTEAATRRRWPGSGSRWSQLVQVVRQRLRAAGETASWTTLRRRLAGQRRVTAVFRQADGGRLPVRKATRAESWQRAIHERLGVDASPGGVRKLVVQSKQRKKCTECSATLLIPRPQCAHCKRLVKWGGKIGLD